MNLYEAAKKALAENKCISHPGIPNNIDINMQGGCGTVYEECLFRGWQPAPYDLVRGDWEVVDHIHDLSSLSIL